MPLDKDLLLIKGVADSNIYSYIAASISTSAGGNAGGG